MNEITKKKPEGLKALINSEAMRNQFALALPKHLTAERFTRIAITALTRTPKLQECTPESFMRCLLDLSALGIEPDGRRAHLIPYGKECTLILDYKGIAELVMRSGVVSSIHADKVCDNDEFEYDCGEVKLHKINFRKPRGNAYAYYVIITFKDGSKKAEAMPRDEVDGIRKRSKAGNSGPWVTDFDEMGKKTVFRRASKWLPLSPEIRDAFEKDDDGFADTITSRHATGRVVNESAKLVNPYEVPSSEVAAETETDESETDKWEAEQ
jgi:recombination protein RecT